MALCGDGSSPMRLLIGWLRGHLATCVAFMVAGLVLLLLTAPRVLSAMGDLFLRDQVTRMAGVQLWVVLTTLLLVVRFLLDFFGPWNANRSMTRIVMTIEMLNYSLVHYTIGLMQLSAARPNDFFQVWAVLLVTLQYSVKIGRPYSRSKQIPLLDLMSSFWTANLLRVQTFVLLKIPLWLTWALNAARIISYFSSTEKAEGINQESNRFVADYMSYEHELSADADHDKEFTMEGYKYLVLGEDQVLKDIREGRLTPEQTKQKLLKRRRRVIRLDPDNHKEIITVDKIWQHADSGLLGGTADGADRLKDVCLSFALYKLLRRRFYDLPVHEARLRTPWEKIWNLVYEYILQDEERAFRILGMELSFLQDLFYSKHAAMFANGFPITNMVLSLLLVSAVGYIAYPVRYIPERMDQADGNRITHGVFVTRVMIFLIAIKELAEIYLYVFSQWTKVMMLCSYVKHRCMRHWLVEIAMRLVLLVMNRGTWDEMIRQHSLLISTRGMVKIPKGPFCHLPSKFPGGIKLEDCTKKAIFSSLKELGTKLEKLKMTELERKQEKELARFDFYFSSASDDPLSLQSQFKWALEFEADTHKILVWHIATCLCEIRVGLAPDKAKKLNQFFLPPRPFVEKPEDQAKWWEHYITAASLSNYCMYMVTAALVPDNGIVAENVLREVLWEINHVTLDGSIRSLLRRRSMQDKYDRLMSLVDMADDEDKQTPALGEPDAEAPRGPEAPTESRTKQGDPLELSKSLTRKGARLAKNLMDTFRVEGSDTSGKDKLWEKLAEFWTGFLLYLAVFTRASKHRSRLAGRRELTTHLWALLSHAGFVGGAAHGHTFLDPEKPEADGNQTS